MTKADVDELDIDKLIIVPADLSRLSYAENIVFFLKKLCMINLSLSLTPLILANLF